MLLRHPQEPARGLNAIYLGRCCTVAEATAGVTHFSPKIMPVTREDRQQWKRECMNAWRYLYANVVLQIKKKRERERRKRKSGKRIYLSVN